MAISGIGSTYSNAYESMYISSKKEVTEKQEGTTEKNYATRLLRKEKATKRAI